MDRVKTGIMGYDKLLGGGYIPETVNLISGCSGAGKTLFATSFIYNGAKQGEQGIYITLEEDVKQISRNCSVVGMNFDEVDPDLFQTYDLSALRKNILTTDDEKSSPESPMLLENLLEFIKINFGDAKRVALDSVVPVTMAYPDMNTFRSELFRFVNGLKQLGSTAVMTTEIPFSKKEISRYGIEDFLADSVTILNIQEEWGRRIKVHKMRGSDHIRDYADYNISTSGLQVMA